MRRSVFLAVWLSLVLSLLKETAATTSATPPVSATTKPAETAATTSATPPVSATTKPAETAATTSATPPVSATTKPAETAATTSATPPVSATTKPAETAATTSATPPVSATTKPAETAATTSATPPVSATTKPAETAATTSATPPVSATTKPAETAATTSATPPVSATTKPAETAATTSATPPVSATTKPADPSATTSATPPVSATTKPADPSATTSATPPVLATTKPAVDFCREYPCGRNLATCISLQSNYTCECQYGFYYSDKNCYRGKVYPATIGVNESYSDRLQTVNSMEYEKVFNNVAAFFEKAFRNLTGYTQTVIVEIQPSKESRNSAPVNVTVTNLFMWNSTVNETSVNSAVQSAIKSGGESYVYSYKNTTSCAVYQCDTQTTECQGDTFPECKCKPGLEKTEWDDRSCSACSKNCTAEAHKYCVKEKMVPVCKCMTNFKQEDGNCVACPVGYSGEECTDDTQLILIIVGTVFGAIILSLVIAVSIISVRAKGKQNPEKRSLIQPEYSNTNRSDDRPGMFPRVQTTSGHANPGYQSNNPYEMRSTNRGHFPERDYDDLYEISREPRGFRMQSRY